MWNKPWFRNFFTISLIVLGAISFFHFGRVYSPDGKVNPKSDEVLDADISILWKTIEEVKGNYVRSKDISDQDLLYGAARGVVRSLGDPYSEFFPPSDAEKFHEDIGGSFGGIGAEIGIRENQLVIIAPLKGNPAFEAGLKSGDFILGVNGTSTYGSVLEEAVKNIRGEVGTKVTLLIFREGWQEPKEFTITRRIVIAPTLDFQMKEDGIAYFQMYNFNNSLSSLFYRSVLTASLSGMRGVIVDVRNNPGGFLEVVNDVLGWFLDKGDVTTIERFASGKTSEFRASGNSALRNIPVVVIVNKGSASASEILAGALRDQRGVKVVGEKTFGKGSVQEIKDLKDGSTLKISIAEWLTPNGTSIHKVGLDPDVFVSSTDALLNNINGGEDKQLEEAIRILKGEMAKRFTVIGYEVVN